MLGPRARQVGSLARLGATRDPHHGLLVNIYDEILAARFDRARDRLRTACPPAPRAACLALEAVSWWWEIVLDPDDERRDRRLQDSAQAAIDEAAAWTARAPQEADAWFYYAGAHAPLVQWRVLRGQRLAAARDGSRIKSALERAFELDSQLHDAKFGIGMYRYYADVVPAPAKMVRWLLWLPGGDKRRGLREMTEARDHGSLLTGEADFQLHLIYLWYERRPDEALARLRALARRYPSNPVFPERIAAVEADYLHDHPASASTWAALLERARRGEVSAARLAQGRARLGLGRELDAMFETDRAIDQFEAVVRSQTTEPFGAQSEAHLRLAQAFDRTGHRTGAAASYDRAVEAAEPGRAAQVRARVRALQSRRPSDREADAYRLSLEGLRALERGDVAAALTATERATALAPRDAVALYRHARALTARGDLAQARARLERVLESSTNAPAVVRASAHVDYAALLERSGERDRAREHYRYALAIVGATRDTQSAARAGLATRTE